MNIAILHYHLNRGGVTSVIAHHLRALNRAAQSSAPLRVAVLFGGRKTGWNEELPATLSHLEISLHAVPALDYDEEQPPGAPPLAGELRTVLSGIGMTPAQTVLHVHNHSLGKNRALPGALWQLAEEGFGLLLQIHDFAEDLRPHNYSRLLASAGTDNTETARTRSAGKSGNDLPLSSVQNQNAALYPRADHIHYAVLNRRDRQLLCGSGVETSRVHFLPNPADDFPALPPSEEARRKLNRCFHLPSSRRWIISPVRGIRRKNVGELLLWSALCGEEFTFGLTLPPLNPVEQPSYQFWKQLSEELQLDCRFELGSPETGMSFTENLTAAEALLTTSVAEGFGMIFLEAWLAGKAITGRDLPEITADFKSAGMRFPGLSPHVWIPVEVVGKEAFVERFVKAFRRLLDDYHRPQPPEKELRTRVESLVQNGLVDFARLDRSLQEQVVRHAATNLSFRRHLRRINPQFDTATILQKEAVTSLVEQNAAVVRQAYSLSGCGRQLRQLYQRVVDSARTPLLRNQMAEEYLLEQFLQPQRFYPLRCEP